MTACNTYVATGGTDGVITIFDIATRTKKCYFPAHHNKSLQVGFTSDERWIMSIGFDKIIFMGDMENPNSKRKEEGKYF